MGWGASGVGSGADSGPVTGHMALSPAATGRSLPSENRTATRPSLTRTDDPVVVASTENLVPRTSTRRSCVATAKVSPARRCATVASTVPASRTISTARAVPASRSRAGPSIRNVAWRSRLSSASAASARTISRSAETRAPTADDAPPIVSVPVTRASVAYPGSPAGLALPGPGGARRPRTTAAAPARTSAAGTNRRGHFRRTVGAASSAIIRSISTCIRRTLIASGASGACARILGAAARQNAARDRQSAHPSMWVCRRTLATGSSRPSTTSTRRASTSLQVTALLPCRARRPTRVVAYIAARCDDGRRAPALSPR